jgi:hypothetical protein
MKLFKIILNIIIVCFLIMSINILYPFWHLKPNLHTFLWIYIVMNLIVMLFAVNETEMS